ncbi:unnamed protein product [Nippostrongylus brasiliensis]|uniref:Acyltransferase 3 domain-containing protein n=1 Tax=Nippostrongylus brasiliensis TaxID=27835 RepID=A0A3P7AZK7_NIPBR|nr:unnamed protein product [Nippostrongylus brasiliensis]
MNIFLDDIHWPNKRVYISDVVEQSEFPNSLQKQKDYDLHMNEKRLDIQGIRGVAIILVLLCHFFPNQFPIGYIGVDIFFVLSGFLIALLLHRTSTISFATIVDFYYRRIKRIIPLYFLTISVTVIAMHITFPSYFRTINADFAKGAFFLTANIENTNVEMGYFYTMQKVENLFMHCWSLSVEMQWYLLAPFLILLQKALTNHNRLFFLAVAAVSFYNFTATDSKEAFFSVWCRLWQFAFGIIAFLFTHKISFLCNPFLVYIGNISYALYLVHWPIYKFIKYWWPGVLGALMQSLTYHESVRWYANYRNTLMPGCKYSKRYTPSAVEPFGFCEHEKG